MVLVLIPRIYIIVILGMVFVFFSTALKAASSSCCQWIGFCGKIETGNMEDHGVFRLNFSHKPIHWCWYARNGPRLVAFSMIFIAKTSPVLVSTHFLSWFLFFLNGDFSESTQNHDSETGIKCNDLKDLEPFNVGCIDIITSGGGSYPCWMVKAPYSAR